jgi:hypothetical protein
MTRALLVAALYLSSAFMASISAANIPSMSSLDKRTDANEIPRGLLEEREGIEYCGTHRACPGNGQCWYVVLTYHYPLLPT